MWQCCERRKQTPVLVASIISQGDSIFVCLPVGRVLDHTHTYTQKIKKKQWHKFINKNKWRHFKWIYSDVWACIYDYENAEEPSTPTVNMFELKDMIMKHRLVVKQWNSLDWILQGTLIFCPYYFPLLSPLHGFMCGSTREDGLFA